MFKKIMSEISPVYGVCSFDRISKHLLECRAKSRIPDNSKSVIIALFPYYLGDDSYKGSDISKYAVVPDYHNVVSALLSQAIEKFRVIFPNEQFEAFCDNSPFPEVYSAVNAGLGVMGKNGLLINEDYGSWVFIGEIVTTMPIQETALESKVKDCIGCGKCIASCPTKALTENGVLKNLCLSDITQKKGKLSTEQISLIKEINCLWGCDICQNVCPMNVNVKVSPIDEFKENIALNMRMGEDISDRAYFWRGIKTVERNLKIKEK